MPLFVASLASWMRAVLLIWNRMPRINCNRMNGMHTNSTCMDESEERRRFTGQTPWSDFKEETDQ